MARQRRKLRHQLRSHTTVSNGRRKPQSIRSSSQDDEFKAPLTNLPPEILNIITEMLTKAARANLAATSRAFKTNVEMKVWRKIRPRIGTSQDTAGLVALLTKRPDIIPMIRILVLDDGPLFQSLGSLTLTIQDSIYSPEALNRFIVPSPNLTELLIQHFDDPPYVPHRYLASFMNCVTTLKVLKLEWLVRGRWDTPAYQGLDLRALSALRLLTIHPSVLLGHAGRDLKSYAEGTNLSITELIRGRLPRGLKILLLLGITVPPPGPELISFLFPMDKEFIRCLVEQKQSLAPRLKYVWMYGSQGMVDPEDLYDLALEHGVEKRKWWRGADEIIESDDMPNMTMEMGQQKESGPMGFGTIINICGRPLEGIRSSINCSNFLISQPSSEENTREGLLNTREWVQHHDHSQRAVSDLLPCNLSAAPNPGLDQPKLVFN
ncbi:MAG: hypothetical protein Q9169_000832 [Polycauliona sp. 2 TL-2023]